MGEGEVRERSVVRTLAARTWESTVNSSCGEPLGTKKSRWGRKRAVGEQKEPLGKTRLVEGISRAVVGDDNGECTCAWRLTPNLAARRLCMRGCAAQGVGCGWWRWVGEGWVWGVRERRL